MGFLGIPGLSFSLSRAVGITKVKQKIARSTGIPTTAGGRVRKAGRAAENLLSSKDIGKSLGTIVAMKAISSVLDGNKKKSR